MPGKGYEQHKREQREQGQQEGKPKTNGELLTPLPKFNLLSRFCFYIVFSLSVSLSAKIKKIKS